MFSIHLILKEIIIGQSNIFNINLYTLVFNSYIKLCILTTYIWTRTVSYTIHRSQIHPPQIYYHSESNSASNRLVEYSRTKCFRSIFFWYTIAITRLVFFFTSNFLLLSYIYVQHSPRLFVNCRVSLFPSYRLGSTVYIWSPRQRIARLGSLYFDRKVRHGIALNR
jgi:hypothetical protein